MEESAIHFPVWISDVNNLQDAFVMIEQVGLVTNNNDVAVQLIAEIKQRFAALQVSTVNRTACYLIWQKPYMTVGGDTFIHAMMNSAGFDNVFIDNKRYPVITIEDIKAKKPEFILLSSEPFPFAQKHADELKIHFPGTKIKLVDGEIFSWYGSRLLYAPDYFLNLREHGLF